MTPADLQALIRHAWQLRRAGAYAQAQKAAQHILELKWNEPNALTILGLNEHSHGKYREAIQLLRRALQNARQSTDVQCYLANAHTGLGEYSKAIAIFDRILRKNPEHPVALAGASHAWEMRGRADKVLALLTSHIRRGSATPLIRVVYARALLQQQEHEQVPAVVAPAMQSEQTVGQDRAELHRVLGKALAKLQKHDEAFEEFAAANALLRQPYDHHRTVAHYDALIDAFDAQAMNTAARSSCDSELPVFVVGMPRCGSTLVEQIIHAHPDGWGAGEISHLRNVLADHLKISALPELLACETAQLDSASAQYLKLLRSVKRGPARIVDKNLFHFEFLPAIAMLFPNARILHIRRDPLDTCLSCFIEALPPAVHTFACDLEDLGKYYAQYDRLMQHWTDVIDGLNILEVQYEALVANQEEVSRDIITFLGLDWDDACVHFQDVVRPIATASYSQVTRPMYNTSVRRHTLYDAHLQPLRNALRRGGYVFD